MSRPSREINSGLTRAETFDLTGLGGSSGSTLRGLRWEVPATVDLTGVEQVPTPEEWERRRSRLERLRGDGRGSAMYAHSAKDGGLRRPTRLGESPLDPGTLHFSAGHRRRLASGRPGLLFRFADLADRTPGEVQAFAKTYGPLRPTPPFSSHTEAVRTWYRAAREVDLILDAIISLNQAEPLDSAAWWRLRGFSTEHPALVVPPAEWLNAEDELRFEPPPPSNPKRVMLNEQRDAIADIITSLLVASGVSVEAKWTRAETGLRITAPPSLRAELAAELADLPASEGMVAKCRACGRYFTPSRKPQAGRDAYCVRKVCKNARKRNYHRRKAGGA